MSQPILRVQNLNISFHTRNGANTVVEDLHFTLNCGEVLGIVGESGSGKSVSCFSLLGLIPTPPGKINSGQALFYEQDLLQLTEAELRKIRGNKIAMIFQDPMASLNPYMRIYDQLVEPLQNRASLSNAEIKAKAIAALQEVGIRHAEQRIYDYPHQFSGGMRQRVMIAMALIGEPELLIADEPTTALDVTVQAQILTLLKSIQKKRKLSIIFITHDLGVAAQMSDKILVLEKGKMVESGSVDEVFKTPQHPYTQKLLSAVLMSSKPKEFQFTASATEPLLKVCHLKTYFARKTGSWWNSALEFIKGVDDVTLELNSGEILGLVGESGSGKSTLGRSIIRLVDSQAGELIFNGINLLTLSAVELKKSRRDIQMIFQDPYASLNPRMTVYETLAEPLLLHGIANSANVLHQVNQLMDDVGLDRQAIRKYPHEFSGGQRQRIAIARAISVKPKLIIADEPVSALDLTIRAQILALILELTKKYQITMLFISHDMSVIRYLCDRVAVMQAGKILEVGLTDEVFTAPKSEYTQELLKAIPVLQS